MTDGELQTLVEHLSKEFFQKPFAHKAAFNPRLRTTGGRYLLKSHNIEINPKYWEEHGAEELEGIIKHELCHYHLHLAGKGHQHRDRDFRILLEAVQAPRFCTPLQKTGRQKTAAYKVYECLGCGLAYKRKRRIDTQKYVCGKCRGRLVLKEILE